MSEERHYFPGNNTPLGFFSYYENILGQREANKIICVKGGPGSGKSTFLRRIGKHFASMGEPVDHLHCSADENSLDGVVLRRRKVALIDGTSPHVTDPVTPGAVDMIVNLGEYWNEEGIAENKDEIIDLSEETSRWYRIAYNYLNAAESVYRSLEEIYSDAAEKGEIYRLVAGIIEREYGRKDISFDTGRQKKFFASAITGDGVINYLPTLLGGMNRIYVINVPSGYSNSSFMEIIAEGAVYRGLDSEAFYCSMCPEGKPEHILIPQTGTAFITVNRYHDLEPWEIPCEEGKEQEVILLDMSDYMNKAYLEKNGELIETLNEEYDILLNKCIRNLARARDTHMTIEDMYAPNMNFTEISELAVQIEKELEKIPASSIIS